MKIYPVLGLLGLLFLNTSVWAYGSSSSAKACEKPKFTDFTPADKADVAPQSAFSFQASSATNPKTLRVTIKDQAVEVSITPKNTGYLVQGKLPAGLTGTVARVNIAAESPSRCKGNDGWLVNVSK